MSKKCDTLRHPRTTQEKRHNCRVLHPDPEDNLFRPCRGHKNLVSAYDDIWLYHSKSWKDNNRPKYRLNRKKKEAIFFTKTERNAIENHEMWLNNKNYYYEKKYTDGHWWYGFNLVFTWWE